jgi:hypothetical protein
VLFNTHIDRTRGPVGLCRRRLVLEYNIGRGYTHLRNGRQTNRCVVIGGRKGMISAVGCRAELRWIVCPCPLRQKTHATIAPARSFTLFRKAEDRNLIHV